jgi:hypothetical protein
MKLTLTKYNQYQPSVTRIQLSIVSIIKIKVKAEPVMGWRDKLNDYASNKGFDMLYGLFDKDQSGQLDPRNSQNCSLAPSNRQEARSLSRASRPRW